MRIKPFHIAFLGTYLSDLTLVTWIYFHMTKLSNFNSVISKATESPDFQVQLYKVFLQSLTFFLLLFFTFQTFIYICSFKNFRSVYYYLKFFSIFAFAVYFFIAILYSGFALLPMCLYILGYYFYSKKITEHRSMTKTH
jgi:hypothetical protein